MRYSWVVIGVIAVIGALIGGTFWLAGAKERTGWRLCDEAIKATLKAPATYQRIMDDQLSSFASGDSSFRITYDAQNGFGVPIRSRGFCTVNADRSGAEWVQMPDTM
jgi:hypothetical protein